MRGIRDDHSDRGSHITATLYPRSVNRSDFRNRTTRGGSALGRPRLDPAIKARRGTLESGRERRRQQVMVRAADNEDRGPAGIVETRDYISIANGYIRDVMAAKIVASAMIRRI